MKVTVTLARIITTIAVVLGITVLAIVLSVRNYGYVAMNGTFLLAWVMGALINIDVIIDLIHEYTD